MNKIWNGSITNYRRILVDLRIIFREIRVISNFAILKYTVLIKGNLSCINVLKLDSIYIG